AGGQVGEPGRGAARPAARRGPPPRGARLPRVEEFPPLPGAARRDIEARDDALGERHGRREIREMNERDGKIYSARFSFPSPRSLSAVSWACLKSSVPW